METTAMTPASVAFNDELEALTSTLGDATRRGIYLAVRGSPTSVTVSDMAAAFDIHPNVARHHLDKLVSDGWLQVTHRRRGQKTGPGAGRPAKHYEPTAKEVSVQFPERRHELLAELLVRTLERMDPERAGDIAEEIGREYGEQLAATRAPGVASDALVHRVATAMLGLGFETTAGPDGRTLVTSSCPFAGTADAHPEIVCRLDKGIVQGLIGSPAVPIALTPRSNRTEVCVTEF